MRRVMIGTIGYFNLRDYSIGPNLLAALQKMQWPAGVEVDEMNWGPIAIVQQFQSLPTPYDRVIFLTARSCGRPVGTMTLRRWVGGLPDAENIQARISEAVTGVISVDNLLIIGEHFNIWPEEVFLVDVEPGKEEMGETFTPEVEAVIDDVLNMIHELAINSSGALPFFEELKGNELLI
jgi:hydrogenase maturation protease